MNAEFRRIFPGLTMLKLQYPSTGVASMGTYSFVAIPTDPRRSRHVPFINGFMDTKCSFTLLGSAGYGLHVKQSEDWRKIVFEKYESQPMRVRSTATYSLETPPQSYYCAFFLPKEETTKLGE